MTLALRHLHVSSFDLEPQLFYDFSLDCQACQAKLSAAQSNLADEQRKTAALTQERDDALRITKGDSVLRRITRAAKWFAHRSRRRHHRFQSQPLRKKKI